MSKKHPAFIVAVDNRYFENNPLFTQGLSEYPASLFIEEAVSHLVIREREHLDNCTNPEGHKGDRRYRQLLPYTIVRRIGEDGVMRYLPYRRTSGVGESRLAGNVSVGYGGHIDMIDVVRNEKSVVDLFATINVAVGREMEEELKYHDPAGSGDGKFDIPISYGSQFILDDSNDVGCVHVGMIMVVDVPTELNVKTAEDELASMDWMTVTELLSSDLPLENWTRIYLENEHHRKSTLTENFDQPLNTAA